MTVSVVEVATADAGSSASSSFALSTTLVSSDLIVLLMTKTSTGASTITINGSALTAYNNWQNATGGTRLFVSSVTGLTGSHSVTYTTASTTPTTRYTALVIRGLTNSAITASAISTWDSTSTSSNTDEGAASQSVGNGQVAIFSAVVGSGTVTFPSNPTPSTGWTTDRLDPSGTGYGSVAHQVFTASGTAQANVRSTSGTQLATAMLIVGDVISSSPLTNTFVGWGNPIF